MILDETQEDHSKKSKINQISESKINNSECPARPCEAASLFPIFTRSLKGEYEKDHGSDMEPHFWLLASAQAVFFSLLFSFVFATPYLFKMEKENLSVTVQVIIQMEYKQEAVFLF